MKSSSIAKDFNQNTYSIQNICELTSQRSQQQQNFFRRSYLTRDSDDLDASLSTNMISVGVDVSRLLMIINGQTKSKSEYIQASSRVGRKFPGIVISVYNANKVRDKSVKISKIFIRAFTKMLK